LWRHQYGEEYGTNTLLYRGEPPSEYHDYRRWNPMQVAATAATAATVTTAVATAVTRSASPPEHDTASMVSVGGTVALHSEWVCPQRNGAEPHVFTPEDAPYHHRHNPKTVEQVYGIGSAGPGYYGLQTRDAYELLRERL
jgi:hypothetical protein